MVTTMCRRANLLHRGQVFDRAEGVVLQRLADSNDFFSLLLQAKFLAGVVMRSPDMTGGWWRQAVDLTLSAKTRVENTTCGPPRRRDASIVRALLLRTCICSRCFLRPHAHFSRLLYFWLTRKVPQRVCLRDYGFAVLAM